MQAAVVAGRLTPSLLLQLHPAAWGVACCRLAHAQHSPWGSRSLSSSSTGGTDSAGTSGCDAASSSTSSSSSSRDVSSSETTSGSTHAAASSSSTRAGAAPPTHTTAAAAAAAPSGRGAAGRRRRQRYSAAELAAARAEIFEHHIGDGRRSGRQAILRSLRGRWVADWYFTLTGPKLPMMYDELEEERVAKVALARATGSGPPKKGQGKRAKK